MRTLPYVHGRILELLGQTLQCHTGPHGWYLQNGTRLGSFSSGRSSVESATDREPSSGGYVDYAASAKWEYECSGGKTIIN